MADEAAIIEIMRSVGILDFVLDLVKDQAEAVEMFVNDFENLKTICTEGA